MSDILNTVPAEPVAYGITIYARHGHKLTFSTPTGCKIMPVVSILIESIRSVFGEIYVMSDNGKDEVWDDGRIEQEKICVEYLKIETDAGLRR